MHPSQHHPLQLTTFGEVQLLVFDLQDHGPIPVVRFGEPTSRDAPLVRVHSRCLYGEVLGSLDCDCRAQLELALGLLKSDGDGVLIYLEQEGRGCGLATKAAAYELNEKEGLDTVEAYRCLGSPIDARLYTAAAAVINYLGLPRVKLLTNNPAKVTGLIEAGIAVEQVYLRTKPTRYNIDYLRVKQLKLGHELGLQDTSSATDKPIP